MPTIRMVEMKNFRGIRRLSWCPNPGVSCLIGPGDSGKSTILDAIDLCLGARRSIQFTDSDFYQLDVDEPIVIDVTVGNLEATMLSIDSYGLFLRSFNIQAKEIDDEPESGSDTVLTVRLKVEDDLEPNWTLYSKRAEEAGVMRGLSWGDRVRLAPTRISVGAENHLTWRRGSLLHRLSEERLAASAELAQAAREARAAFGDEMQEKLQETLQVVAETAEELGVPTGGAVQGLLDAQAVSLRGGAISLHDADGIPLGGLGIGSTRLLTAGLHRRAKADSHILLMDELEHGLEPHRIIRLVGSLGAKESPPPLQAFVTTHSPVALRELSGDQLFVVRGRGSSHRVLPVGTEGEYQGTIRSFPEAFLAPSVIVCEGATEVGLIRGIDQYLVGGGRTSIYAQGVSLVDAGGGNLARVYERALAFITLGYNVAIFRDADVGADEEIEGGFVAAGGNVFTWEEGCALEDALFLNLPDHQIRELLDYAGRVHGESLVDDHIRSTDPSWSLEKIRTEASTGSISIAARRTISKAAKTKKRGWFKSVAYMEDAARTIVGPGIADAEAGLRDTIMEIFAWSTSNG